ncbi:glutathione S-transferase [Altererythrobacter halimionae]|uniref:Glutathione S-transferase n=2 Tax=Alteriqipengyuania halimionae TaxID=1926630 RepID=A0A6I4U3N4_9SPHN|nr:glutathione S-transferase [Alteriqipengyuania halimionae]
MAKYTFFTNPLSRAWIAWWALHEVDADYRPVIVNWSNKPDELARANPMGKVPTLVHHHEGDHIHVVTETAAICHYLAEAEASELAPRDEERADYFRWLFFAAGPVEQATTAKTMGFMPTPEQEVMTGFGSLERTVDTLESWFSQNAYVCGDRFTMADVYVGAQVDWGLRSGTMPKRDALARYADAVRSRDAYRHTEAVCAEFLPEQSDDA